MKKFLSLFMAGVLTIGSTACSNTESGNAGSEATSGKPVEISILMGKPEVADQFEKMVADYGSQNNVNVTIIPLAGQNAYEKLTSLYASGNAPTISMVGQEFGEFQTQLLDITDTDVVKNANEGTLDFVTVDGKVFGIPTTVEAYGIIYNERIVQEVMGTDFDATSIDTRSELDELFSQLQANGQGAFTLSPMDWSLGAHLSNSIYTNQSDTYEGRHAFFDELKQGKVNLMENEVYNGFMDTFDLLIQNNIHTGSPLAPVYEDGPLDLGIGDAATWFMGNWAYPDLVKASDDAYKFIPVPISDDENDYGNGKIAVGVPSYWVIDKSATSPEQQQAAIDFLTWFTTTTDGQDYYVNKLNFIPAYKGFTVQPNDPMSAQVAEMLVNGETLEWMNTYYPAGGFQVMGASMQKYIDGKIDRAGLAKEFEDYWKSVE